MSSNHTRHAEVRELEAQLEESLLILEHAETHRQPVFAPIAKIAVIQLRLDQLRGTVVAEHPERRAAWVAHLVSSGRNSTAHDSTTCSVQTPASSYGSRVFRKGPTTGANSEFPQID